MDDKNQRIFYANNAPRCTHAAFGKISWTRWPNFWIATSHWIIGKRRPEFHCGWTVSSVPRLETHGRMTGPSWIGIADPVQLQLDVRTMRRGHVHWRSVELDWSLISRYYVEL